MDIGATVAFSHRTPVDYIVGAAKLIEAAGFTSVWVPEHVLFFPNYTSRYPYAEDGRGPGDPDGGLTPPFAGTLPPARACAHETALDARERLHDHLLDGASCAQGSRHCNSVHLSAPSRRRPGCVPRR